MSAPTSSARMTYEEFLAAYDGTHAEWVDGEVIPMTPVSPRHQRIANFLVALLQHFAESRGAGMVLSAPVQMKVGSSAREPDVQFLTSEHLDRVQESCVRGPADLVVEIISPESRGRDRGEKFYEYEQAGVREYWLVDPVREVAEFYALGERGVYEPLSPDPDGRLSSRALPGLWIRVDWFWQDPMPPLLSVLREWGLV